MPAIPLPASTVVLVRPDAERRFEIYLNRRPEQMDTYAGVYVFPGGRVEASDWSTAMINLTRGITPDEVTILATGSDSVATQGRQKNLA